MLSKKELEAWLATLPADVVVWVDEGGLTLCSDTGGYLEVGGEADSGE